MVGSEHKRRARRQDANGPIDPTTHDWRRELTLAASDLPACLGVIDRLRAANRDLQERIYRLESVLDHALGSDVR
jgi:hypothetical protein